MKAKNRVEGGDSSGNEGVNPGVSRPDMTDDFVDVAEDEGWIAILSEELTDWRQVPHITSFLSLDRVFVFPGEEVHVLACLPVNELLKENNTPFKDADSIRHAIEKQNQIVGEQVDSVLQRVDGDSDAKYMNHSDRLTNHDSALSHVRTEYHMRANDKLLQKFKRSHFLVRIAESDEALWSKRSSEASNKSKLSEQDFSTDNFRLPNHAEKRSSSSVIVDRGSLDSCNSGELQEVLPSLMPSRMET